MLYREVNEAGFAAMQAKGGAYIVEEIKHTFYAKPASALGSEVLLGTTAEGMLMGQRCSI